MGTTHPCDPATHPLGLSLLPYDMGSWANDGPEDSAPEPQGPWAFSKAGLAVFQQKTDMEFTTCNLLISLVGNDLVILKTICRPNTAHLQSVHAWGLHLRSCAPEEDKPHARRRAVSATTPAHCTSHQLWAQLLLSSPFHR